MTARACHAVRILEVAGLLALGVAHPVLDLLAANPTFFVAHRARPAEVVALVAMLVLGPPAAVAALAAIASAARPGASRAVYAVSLAVAAAGLASVPLERAGLGVAAWPAALLVGVAVAALRARSGALRGALAFSGVSLAVVPVLFLLHPGVAGVLDPAPPAEAGAPVLRPAPVVMLVLDELPLSSLLEAPGRIDARRYPGFAELAATSTWYSGALATATATDLALPALLTGRPPRGGAPSFATYPESLFSLLRGTYELRALETVTALCPPSWCAGPRAGSRGTLAMLADASAVYLHYVTPSALAAGLPPVQDRWGGFWDGARAGTGALDAWRDPGALLRTFGEGIARSERPALHFAHVPLPHMPHLLLPTGQRYAAGWDEQPQVWPPDGAAAALAEQRHLLQVGATDALLRALVDALRASGVWDEALVVVTADHGVSYRPGHPSRAADEATLGDAVPIPLFVKAPAQREGRREDRALASVDVLPIVAAILGVRSPPPAERAAAGAGADGGGRAVLDEHGTAFRFTNAAAALEEAVRRKVALYGTGSFERVLARGVRAELLGLPVAALDTAPAMGSATLDQAALLEDVDTRGPFVPALLSGRITGARAEALALSLNGVVAAVATPSDDGRFRAVARWALLRDGPNEVRLFAASGDARLPLREIPIGRGVDGISPEALDVGGRRLPIRPGDPPGEVEILTRDGRQVFVFGWAGDRDAGRPAAEVVVFLDGRCAWRGAPGVRRFDLAASRGRAFEYAGFAASVPVSGPGEVRVFAISPDGHAAELPRSPPRPAQGPPSGGRGTPARPGPM